MTVAIIITVLIFVGSAILFAWIEWGGGDDYVTWSSHARVSLPPSIARAELVRYMKEQGYDARADPLKFRRGEDVSRRLSRVSEYDWLYMSLIASASVWRDGTGSGIAMCFGPGAFARLKRAAADDFRQLAAAEFNRVMEHLNLLAREHAEWREWKRRKRRPNHRWYPGDDEAEAAQGAPVPADSLDADLAVLGLSRGASWDDVQRAYRDACRKYHPDRLNGQNVEPHLVELAVQRFKEVTDAYRRLRDRMAQHA
ncbi:MAG: J domain-containing protein [Phycisphaerales bacterium]|nr:J domain-containing protein [Phycisphaerales bacterium]